METKKGHSDKVSKVIQAALNDMGLLMILVGVKKIHNGQNDKSPDSSPTKVREKKDLESALSRFGLSDAEWTELLHSLNQGTVDGQTIEDYLNEWMCTKAMKLKPEWVP